MGGRGSSSGYPNNPLAAIQQLQAAQQQQSQAYKLLNYTNSPAAQQALANAQQAVQAAQQQVQATSGQRQSVPMQITTFVQTQVGIDLSLYTTETTRRFGGGVVIDWKGMTKRDQTRVIQALNSPYSQYKMESWSAWQMLIRKRSPNDPF